MTASGASISFWVFAITTVIGAVCAMGVRNPVNAALFLVLTLFGTGGVFLALDATFLAVIQILVYAGAVMVLFVFVIMSVGNYDQEELGLLRGTLSKIVGIAATAVLIERALQVILRAAPNLNSLASPDFGTVRSLGARLFSDYLFAFEAISLLLLVTIVGAVMLTRRVTSTQGQHHQTITPEPSRPAKEDA